MRYDSFLRSASRFLRSPVITVNVVLSESQEISDLQSQISDLSKRYNDLSHKYASECLTSIRLNDELKNLKRMVKN